MADDAGPRLYAEPVPSTGRASHDAYPRVITATAVITEVDLCPKMHPVRSTS
jgi:hypothetical protein